MKSRPHSPEVLMLVDADRTAYREMLRGITRFAQLHGRWNFVTWLQVHGPSLEHWRGDGVIFGEIQGEPLARSLKSVRCPVVALHDQFDGPRAVSDKKHVGRLAAEHLANLGFQRCGFVGYRTAGNGIMAGFEQAIRARGVSLHSTYHMNRDSSRGIYARRSDRRSHQRLTRWLLQQPKPIGLMTEDDAVASLLLRVCKTAGIRVPDEVAVVAGSDDDLICGLASPSLTCVDLAGEEIGWQAAALLHRLMCGEPAPETLLMIPPKGVIVRGSTDVLAVADPDVAAALRFIREKATSPITIEDVLEEVTVSRATLDRRFDQVLGRTVAAEIRRVRIERARQLLTQGEGSLAEVAASAGFSSAEYMSEVFRRELKVSPGSLKRRA